MPFKKSIIFILLSFLLLSCKKKEVSDIIPIDYSISANWAFYPQNQSADVDVFFVAPTVVLGDEQTFSMNLDDETSRRNFIGAVNMQKGIYDDYANFYAPFYRQATLSCFQIRNIEKEDSNKEVNKAFEMAFEDVRNAFRHFSQQSDKPFILAGFSQGAEMIIELIKNEFSEQEIQNRFIAAYAIGWRLLPSDVNHYPQLKQAQGKDDLGVVICYSSEAEFIENSLIVPDTTHTINPLNWTCTTTLAERNLNLGACFTNYEGEITSEIPNFSGAYISPKRGTLKVPDVDATNYLPVLGIFQKGEYHIYDYMFFYRNLEANVKTRIDQYWQLNNK